MRARRPALIVVSLGLIGLVLFLALGESESDDSDRSQERETSESEVDPPRPVTHAGQVSQSESPERNRSQIDEAAKSSSATWIVVDDSALDEGDFVGVAIATNAGEAALDLYHRGLDLAKFPPVAVEVRNGRKGFELPLVELSIIWVQTREGLADVVGMVNQRGRMHGETRPFVEQLIAVPRWGPHRPLSQSVKMAGDVPVISLAAPGTLRVSFADEEGAPVASFPIALTYAEAGRVIVDPQWRGIIGVTGRGTSWELPVPPNVPFTVSAATRRHGLTQIGPYAVEPPGPHRVDSGEVYEVMIRRTLSFQMVIVVEGTNGERLANAEAVAMTQPDPDSGHRDTFESSFAEADSHGRIQLRWTANDSDWQFPEVHISAAGYRGIAIPFQSQQAGEVVVRLTELGRLLRIRLQDVDGELMDGPVTARVVQQFPNHRDYRGADRAAHFELFQGETDVAVREDANLLVVTLQSDEYDFSPSRVTITARNEDKAVFTLVPLGTIEISVTGLIRTPRRIPQGTVGVAPHMHGRTLGRGRAIGQRKNIDDDTEWPVRFRVPEGEYRVLLSTQSGQVHNSIVYVEGLTEYPIELGDPLEVYEYEVRVPSEMFLNDRSFLRSGPMSSRGLRQEGERTAASTYDKESQRALARRRSSAFTMKVDPHTSKVWLPKHDDTWHLVTMGLGKFSARVDHATRTVTIEAGTYAIISGSVVTEVDGELEAIPAIVAVLFPVIGDDPTRDFGSFVVHTNHETNTFRVYLPPGRFDLFAAELDGENEYILSPGQRIELSAGQQVEIQFHATLREQ